MQSALMYLVPFVLTLALAGALRFFVGAERGARAAGVAVVVGFLAPWGIFLKPGWMHADDFVRMGHIAFGAGLAGFILDAWAPRRLWAAIVAGVVILVSTWASLNGSLRLHGPVDVEVIAAVVVLSVGAFLILARLDAARERGGTALVLLIMATLGLTVMAAVVGDMRLTISGAMLAAALLALALLQGFVGLPSGDAVILGGGGIVLALAWALGHGQPDARLGLLLVPLVLFAEGTAQRVSLPKARISMLLGPLVLAGVAALPLILAIIVVYVMAHA